MKIHHFVGKGYNERERRFADTAVGDLDADLEYLMRAVRKVEAIPRRLGQGRLGDRRSGPECDARASDLLGHCEG